MLIVQKFGGSPVATAERIMNAAKRVIDGYNKGDAAVAVLSAKGDTADTGRIQEELKKRPSS